MRAFREVPTSHARETKWSGDHKKISKITQIHDTIMWQTGLKHGLDVLGAGYPGFGEKKRKIMQTQICAPSGLIYLLPERSEDQ